MFETTHEAAGAYGTAVWRLTWPQTQMNFHSVFTCQQAQYLALPPCLVIEEDRRVQRNLERHLVIVDMDESVMMECC
ncbi:Protein TRANSPARENT TESTA 12 [Hordeum vulgare]|nr:Protein TRANSPARENT TESTA 12 [Hordeum vulgare]